MKIVKRFKCPKCDYLSPAGYLVEGADCPWCKIPMAKGFYEQYKKNCKVIDHRNGGENEEMEANKSK